MYLVPKKTNWPCVTFTRPNTAGYESASQAKVGFHLHVLREGALKLHVRRSIDLDIEVHAAQQAGARRRNSTGCADLPSSELKSDCGLKLTRTMLRSHLRCCDRLSR